jgi:hypothetical protein
VIGFVLVPIRALPIIAADTFATSIAMSALEINAPQRFSFTLDPGLVLERLILARLSGLKRKRAQDWLRALLVQGFLVEGQWLRSERHGGGDRAAPVDPTVPPTPFASWLRRATVHPQREGVPAPVPMRRSVAAMQTLSQSTTESKPFAHLRKVIG